MLNYILHLHFLSVQDLNTLVQSVPVTIHSFLNQAFYWFSVKKQKAIKLKFLTKLLSIINCSELKSTAITSQTISKSVWNRCICEKSTKSNPKQKMPCK